MNTKKKTLDVRGMDSLFLLWSTLGEPGVLDFLIKLKKRLVYVRNSLSDATNKRAYLNTTKRGRSWGGAESFQFSRTLISRELDSVILLFATEERTLESKIKYVTLSLMFARRLQHRGIYDWGVFED